MNLENPLYLYILMRTDMWSMNPGKQAAQACHAANQFIYEWRKNGNKDVLKELDEWESQSGYGFGTTITLDVDEKELNRLVKLCKHNDIVAGITHDPTYPISDGENITHLVPIDTCGYIFGYKNDGKLKSFLRNLELLN